MTGIARTLWVCALAAVAATFGFPVDGRALANEAMAQEVPIAKDPRNATVGIYFRGRDGGEICTGVFIANGLLLTAGHCACAPPETYIIALNRNMPLGVYERSDAKTVLKNDPDSLGLKRAPIPFDPGQCARGALVPGSDLALLVVDLDGVLCGEKGSPPCATEFREPVWSLLKTMRAGASVSVIGLGQTETNARGEKRIVDIPILSPACYPERFNQNCAPFKEMIISGPGNKDSCGGDSGGPVFLRRDSKFLLIAITSREAPGLVAGAGDCGGGGIYTLLGRRSVLAWIDENLKKYARAN